MTPRLIISCTDRGRGNFLLSPAVSTQCPCVAVANDETMETNINKRKREEPSLIDKKTNLVVKELQAIRKAVLMIHSRLSKTGYPDVVGVWSLVDSSLVDEMEAQLGHQVPMVLRLFWEHVGGISLVDLKEYQHVAFFNKEMGLSWTSDPIHVDTLNNESMNYYLEEFETWRENFEDTEEEEQTETFLIPLAPDDLHKDKVSGGGPFGLYLGADDWKPQWTDGCDPKYAFLDYLNYAIYECGGFPGLADLPELEEQDKFQNLKQELTKDLPRFIKSEETAAAKKGC